MLADWIRAWLASLWLPEVASAALADLLGLLALCACAWVANVFARKVVLRVLSRLIHRSATIWDDVFLEVGVFARLSHVAPALLLDQLGDAFVRGPRVLRGLNAAVDLYLVVIGLLILDALLKAVIEIYGRQSTTQRVPLKGFAQALMLAAYLIAFFATLSIVLQRSPVFLLSGVGALTALALLIFKDALLGFVAGIQISVNRMVQLGDWIEMEKYGADGEIIDVSLTTVKVRNWDMTITTVPTYALISDPVKNWRAMSESGGRRIKRSLLLDMQTLRFVDEALFDRLMKISRLRTYLEEKRHELKQWNDRQGVDTSVAINGRYLTNIGCLRAYALAYLRSHPQLNQNMTMLVRQLEPTAQGLPLEIYAFVSDTRWAAYESVQSDIFDHLLTAVPEFDLMVYQTPSGRDVREASADRVPAAAALQ